MLRRSFVLLPGVGEKTERTLWKQGVDRWEAFHEADPSQLPGRVERHYPKHVRQLRLAEEHLASQHTAPFARWLPSGESWRLIEELSDRALYLDIETTGLSYPQGRTTVVGSHLPAEGTQLLVRGRDLSAQAIQERLDQAACIVTFNGKRFDIPFLEREFGITVDAPHVDLMYAFRKLGVTGGLKSIERDLGLAREGEIEGMDGYEAVKLWRRHRRGDREALETLLAYNEADVVNMVPLAEIAYRRLREGVYEQHRPSSGGEDGQARLALDP